MLLSGKNIINLRVWLIASFLLSSLLSGAQQIKGSFALQHAASGLYIRIKDAQTKDGTAIVAHSPVNWKCVTWDFQTLEENRYQLVNLFSGKTLMPELPLSEKSPLAERPLLQNDISQGYELIPENDGQYRIRLASAQLFITLDKDAAVNDTIFLASKRADGSQLWKLIEQHPTQ